MKTLLNAVFAVGILAAALAGLGKAVFFPQEINEYENRYMEQFAPLTVENYLNGTFQEQAAKALGDQLPLATEAKELYNTEVSEITNGIFDSLLSDYKAQMAAAEAERLAEEERKARELEELAQKEEEGKLSEEEKAAIEAAKEAERLAAEKAAAEALLQDELSRGIYRGQRNQVQTDPAEIYFTLPSGRLIYKDHLMYANRFLDGEKDKLDAYITGINQVIERHPEITFYMYYIEKETDVNFQTGERSGIFEYLHENILLPEENKRGFLIDRFRDFDCWFFKTDHHWSGAGSYRGYTQVLDMLKPGDKALEPIGYTEVGMMSGSKAEGSDTQTYREPIGVYSYDLDDIKITLNGKASAEYGRQLAYVQRIKDGKAMWQDTNYRAVYGTDDGEAVFENENSDGGSILVLGESYDNALMLLLSNHFSTIYNVDLRNYKAQVGKTFNFDQYVADHDITRVLLIGNLDYYVLSSFRLK